MTRFESITVIPDNHPSFPDHFPNNPMLPGSIIAELVVEAAENAGWTAISIDAMKFGKSVVSGGSLQIIFEKGDNNAVRFKCIKAEAVVASGTLRIG